MVNITSHPYRIHLGPKSYAWWDARVVQARIMLLKQSALPTFAQDCWESCQISWFMIWSKWPDRRETWKQYCESISNFRPSVMCMFWIIWRVRDNEIKSLAVRKCLLWCTGDNNRFELAVINLSLWRAVERAFGRKMNRTVRLRMRKIPSGNQLHEPARLSCHAGKRFTAEMEVYRATSDDRTTWMRGTRYSTTIDAHGSWHVETTFWRRNTETRRRLREERENNWSSFCAHLVGSNGRQNILNITWPNNIPRPEIVHAITFPVKDPAWRAILKLDRLAWNNPRKFGSITEGNGFLGDNYEDRFPWRKCV